MENLISVIIITALVLFGLFQAFLRFWRGYVESLLKDKTRKLSQSSLDNFCGIVKFISHHRDFYLKNKRLNLNKILHSALMDVASSHIQRSHDINSLNGSILLVWRRVDFLMKDEKIQTILCVKNCDSKKIMEDILLNNEAYITEVLSSYIGLGKTEILISATSPDGILMLPENIGLDRSRLNYLDKLRVAVKEKIDEQIYV